MEQEETGINSMSLSRSSLHASSLSFARKSAVRSQITERARYSRGERQSTRLLAPEILANIKLAQVFAFFPATNIR